MNARTAQRFPLVARPQPSCRPLAERVEQEICAPARALLGARPGEQHRGAAAAAQNKAALIASDCGLPDLARSFCWQHFDAYRPRPLDAQTARYALEPVLNLARLRIRDGDGTGAHRLLETLYQAVTHRTDALIDGRPLNLDNLTRSEDDHRRVCRWLWTVLLTDGTRALASAGRWHEALAHAEHHHGIGRRLLDGRQVAIIAHRLTGNPAAGQTLLNESTPAEPWERAVAACLAVLCAPARRPSTGAAVAAMAEEYIALDTGPDLRAFRIRLGLAVIDLAGGIDQPPSQKAATHVIT